MADKATAVSFRYGDRGQHTQFRGVKGEITVDVSTPTLWVHTGDESRPGTPLAREDLDNVTQSAITDKGIAKNDLTNITISDPTTVRGKLSALNYAQRDLSDINETAYTTLDATYARKTLANVDKTSITHILDGNSTSENTYAKADLSNITAAQLAAKDLAKTDLTNVTASTIKGKGIASDTLDNVTLTDTMRDTSHLDLQKVSNLIDISANNITADNYPTASSVKQAIDAIPSMITDVVVDTNTASQTVGQVTIKVSKVLLTQPLIKLINNDIITGTWALKPSDVSNKTWIFTPTNSTETMKILTDSWVITVA